MAREMARAATAGLSGAGASTGVDRPAAVELSLETCVGFLAEEMAVFGQLVAQRDGEELAKPTPAYGWRVIDVLTHLTFLDRLFILALHDPERYAAAVAAFKEGIQSLGDAARHPETLFRATAENGRSALGHPGMDEVPGLWAEGSRALVAALANVSSDRRIAWFGRPMAVARVVSARHMELWAYGQDVYDSFGASREEGDRVIQVADFGARAFRFSYANRGLAAPPRPAIALTTPSGTIWEWEGDAANRIEGAAADFALVVTQRRHVEDTALRVDGATAAEWMRISQCIIGPVLEGPAPGERVLPRW